ncbi:MAG: HAD-IA family hydrolase, partial [Pseudomonadota bacterium]
RLWEMNLEIDRGAPLAAKVAERAALFPDDAALIGAFAERWIEMTAADLPGSVALLRGLRAAGVPCHALSNYGRETFALAEEVYPFLKEFDDRFISAHLGVIKPEAAIYEAVETATGLAGPDLFFTDDREDNCAAAEARGWQVHRFVTSEGLAEALRELGLPASL